MGDILFPRIVIKGDPSKCTWMTSDLLEQKNPYILEFRVDCPIGPWVERIIDRTSALVIDFGGSSQSFKSGYIPPLDKIPSNVQIRMSEDMMKHTLAVYTKRDPQLIVQR